MGGIGFWAPNATVAPATENSPAGEELEQYVFTTPVRKAVLQSRASDGPTMYIRFNTNDANKTLWDASLVAGDPPLVTPDGLLISSLSVYFMGAATFGTHFSIRGWV